MVSDQCRFRDITERWAVKEEAAKAVRVDCPGRIHSALLNMSGLFGRVDGGIGFSVACPSWSLIVRPISDLSRIIGNLPPEYMHAVKACLEEAECNTPRCHFEVEIVQEIPQHVGLGSKTSLLLGVAAGICASSALPFSAVRAAHALGRGGTSGIGTHSFSGGGFIWDAGRSHDAKSFRFIPSSSSSAPPPTLILRSSLAWLDVVHFRLEEVGIHGVAEVNAFADHCPVPRASSMELLALVAGMLVPAVLEHDEHALQRSLDKVQTIGFKQVEWDLQSSATLEFRRYWQALAERETLCLSSFGPTLYVLTRNADAVIRRIKDFCPNPYHLTHTKVSSGFSVSTTSDAYGR